MGIIIALVIISVWAFHLIFILNYCIVNFGSPFFYIHIIVQSYLYTGLFITAHDAMHGNISKDKAMNNLIGTIASFLFAALSYKKLIAKHRLHHFKPGTADDPDFNTKSQNPLIWWLTFLYRYSTISQIIIMGLVFNILNIFFSWSVLWFFWILPAFIGSFQLFYFGTYQPHKYPHTDVMGSHRARTQRSNHILAMLTCYFFGYHHEHHASPVTPWWKLYSLKGRG